ncbi:MAG TPA: porin [Moraxellaceae bacterium]|nr:porin [Moraxellaceae bacterium]
MNRKLLVLAVGAAMTLPLAAQAAPTLYGKLDLSLDYANVDVQGSPKENNWQVNSNSSTLGVKGAENLGSGLAAIYDIEYSIDGSGMHSNDNGSQYGDLFARDRFAGLKSDSLGTVRLGRFGSPLKMAAGSVDVFAGQRYADMGNPDGALIVDGQNWLSGAVGYTSPKFGDALTVDLAVQPREQPHGKGGTSVALNYDMSNVHLALAGDFGVQDGLYDPSNVGSGYTSTMDMRRDTIRLVGSVDVGQATLGALLQQSKQTDKANGWFDPLQDGGSNVFPLMGSKADKDSVLVSAALHLDKANTLKGELGYNKTKFDSAAGEYETDFVGAGLDHNFTQATKIYGLVAYRNLKPNDTAKANGATDDKRTSVSLGIQTLF